MDEQQPEVKTIRQSQAAFLRMVGFRFLRMEKTSRPRQRMYVFSTEMPVAAGAYYLTVDELLHDFEYNQVQMPFQPNTYFNEIMTLKSMTANDWDDRE